MQAEENKPSKAKFAEISDAKPVSNDFASALSNSASFEQAMKMATFLSRSTFIPATFQGKPSDCLIALHLSASLGVSVLDAMNGIYVVHGRPSFSSKFAIGLANIRGPFTGAIEFETTGTGQGMSVKALATMRTSKTRVSATITMGDVDRAGWSKKNSNYAVIPEQMLSYKAAMMLIRKYCPEILMGMTTTDEANEASASITVKPENKAVEALNEIAASVKKEVKN